MKLKLKIVTRSSNLALKQVQIVSEKFKHFFDISINKIKTTADLNLDKPLYEIGGKDQVSYLDIFKTYAMARHLKRYFIFVPFKSLSDNSLTAS